LPAGGRRAGRAGHLSVEAQYQPEARHRHATRGRVFVHRGHGVLVLAEVRIDKNIFIFAERIRRSGDGWG
jgi:hypothetical protein